MTPMNTCRTCRYWLGHVDTYEAICLDGPSEPAAACMQHAEIREFGEDYELGGGRHAVPLHTTADMACGLWQAAPARVDREDWRNYSRELRPFKDAEPGEEDP